MRARKIALGIVLVGALILCVRALVAKPSEPEYQGRPLSFWAKQFWIHGNVPVWAVDTKEFRAEEEARNAIRAIGTNAVPLLLQWIDYQPPRWHKMPPSWAPEWVVRFVGAMYSRDYFNVSRGVAACFAFRALGSNAASAIPSLAAMLTNYNDRPLPASFAVDSLSCLGTQALPYLLSVRTNCCAPERQRIGQAIANNLVPGMHDTSSVPFLLSAVVDGDETLRGAATNALRRIAPELLTNSSAR